MLTKQDNEFLTRVGPGTPMGTLMREYWIPALLSAELAEPDGAPYRLRLLCEDLIAFRTTSGGVGVMQNACPHRGASMFFGRNEEDGLRCVYHGWKFDVTGACVDMPNEPAESNFKHKIKATAYPTRERNGVVWVYMGPRAELPPLPDIEPNLLTDRKVSYLKTMRACNWVQGLEGDIDTSHLGFLHLGHVNPSDVTEGSFDYYTVRDRQPRYTVIDTDFGTMYGAYRPAQEGANYWRFASFLFPFYTMIPTNVLGIQILVRAWVPIDDDHMMFWSFDVPETTFRLNIDRDNYDANPANGMFHAKGGYLPDGSGSLDKWRLAANAGNDYLIDRENQKHQTYTGLTGIYLQDQAVTEAMGTVVDRTKEHLGSADVMVIRTRRRLVNAAKALVADGAVPPGVENPAVYGTRSGGVILATDADWLEATKDLRLAFTEHPELDDPSKVFTLWK